MSLIFFKGGYLLNTADFVCHYFKWEYNLTLLAENETYDHYYKKIISHKRSCLRNYWRFHVESLSQNFHKRYLYTKIAFINITNFMLRFSQSYAPFTSNCPMVMHWFYTSAADQKIIFYVSSNDKITSKFCKFQIFPQGIFGKNPYKNQTQEACQKEYKI